MVFLEARGGVTGDFSLDSVFLGGRRGSNGKNTEGKPRELFVGGKG